MDKNKTCETCRWFRDAEFFNKTLYSFPGGPKAQDGCGINERKIDHFKGIATGTHSIKYPFIDKMHSCEDWEKKEESKHQYRFC